MFDWTISLLALAILSGVMGFGGFVIEYSLLAKALSLAFLVLLFLVNLHEADK